MGSEKERLKSLKKGFEKNQKKFEKSLDKQRDMWYTLWAVSEEQQIGPWKLNNEIRKGTRDSIVQDTINEEF